MSLAEIQAQREREKERMKQVLERSELTAENEAREAEEPIGSMERMLQERKNPTFDLRDRYWKMFLISKVLTYGFSSTEVITAVDLASSTAGAMSILSDEWERELAHEFRLLTLDEHLQEEQFADVQKLFDNVNYQPDNYDRSLQALDIKSKTDLRMKGMRTSVQLHPWQVTGAGTLHDMYLQDNMKGAMLADQPGLGKTWTCAAFLLKVSRLDSLFSSLIVVFLIGWKTTPESVLSDGRTDCVKQLAQRQSSNTTIRRRPILVEAPPQIIEQFAEELLKVTGKFTIYRYHGDSRGPSPNESLVQITEPSMTRESDVFKGTNLHMRIVITTPPTLSSRNGPKKQAEWRVQTQGWTKAEAWRRENLESLDPEFPYSLENCFEVVIIDEAQSIKSRASQAHITTRWLAASWYLLMTATPLMAGAADWA